MPDDERTQTYRRWARPPTPTAPVDPIHALRTCLTAVRQAPDDQEARRRLRATAAEHGAWDELAAILNHEIDAADGPDVMAAMFEELADVRENLDQPKETIAALERLVESAPDALMYRDRLARLYDRSGAWEKAAAMFEEVARIAPGAAAARASLRAAARLYRDHGARDRAVAVYRAIAASHPNDTESMAALEDLLSELERWGELAELRGTLAAHADDAIEKAALLRAQARAHDQAGDTSSAAAVLAEASQLAPEDVSGLVDYATVLAREGRGGEAAEMIAVRIADATSAGAPTDEVAGLRLRLAAIHDDACGDLAAAATVLEQLVAEAPQYLPAIERLVDTARKLRDAGDSARAVRAFEAACDMLPDADLERERDDARAAVLVARAAEEARGGDTASAERRLRAVLATRRHDVDANLAIAQLLADSDRKAAAVDHLRETLASAPDDMPPKSQARLVHRFAIVLRAIGENDEAHQALHEAHRLDRHDLTITLALGDSSFARRLWREASLHLGSLATHPDATAHATAVSAALMRAALADVRGLRPASAEARYAAAARIDPGCAPAWHALAEIANERGDAEGAAEYLEREAHATVDRATRVRLFDALGDLALDVLGQSERAERCWAQVAHEVDADDAGRALLAKLLDVQRRRGAGVERAETCERLAAIAREPSQRKRLAEEATDAFAAGGDVARARAIADRLIAEHPDDIDAVASASAVAIAAGDHAAAASWLERVLLAGGGGASGDIAESTDRIDIPIVVDLDVDGDDPRRALLWRRLGDARRAAGDAVGAQTAYERAIAGAPESDGALAARRGLIALGSAPGRSLADSLAAVVEAELDRDEIAAWARAHATTDVATARTLFQLARALGSPHADDKFLARHPMREMASDQAYAPLDDAERRALIDDAADQPFATLFETLGEALALICPDATTALARAKLAGAERLSATSPSAAAAMYPQIVKALGGPTALLYAAASDPDLTLLLASPPIVVLDPKLAKIRARSTHDGDARGDAGLRFRLGRATELARTRRVFAATTTTLGALVEALWHACVRPDDEPDDPDVAIEAIRLRQALPMLVRRRVAEQLVAMDSRDPSRFVEASTRAADRAGLLACGDVEVAIRLAGGPGVARHLVRMAASPRYHAAARAMRAL